MTEAAFSELAPLVGVRPACGLLGKPPATHYRRLRPPPARPSALRPTPPNALSPAERRRILEVLHLPCFADLAIPQVWARLLDDGIYLASVSTFYRVARSAGEVRERRRQATHPPRVRPELVALSPNWVWSYDLTKLRGPERGSWYALWVMLDIWSRYVIHWIVTGAETAEVAESFVAEAVARAGESPATVHADRGSPMTAKPVAQLLADLGVARSHSRPHVSNDNPFSESNFKTLKYCPAFPTGFGSSADARAFCSEFFTYYNHEHRHSALGLHTPASVHFGTAPAIRARRGEVLQSAYAAHPERFHQPPVPPELPTVAWINQPKEALIQTR